MQELFEYFDKRVQVKYRKSSTTWEGTFGIDNNLYRIYFNRFASSEWTVDFTYVNEAGEETYLPTGTGKAMTVLSTVFNEIADFLADVDPDMLSFSGRNDTGQSRLYTRIMKSFLAPKAMALGYEIDSADNGTYVEFVIIKPGYVENNDLYEDATAVYDNMFADSDFLQWFSGSAIADASGAPKIVYHETSTENARSIYDHGLRQGGSKASTTDYEMPFGFFFKPSIKRIGVGGENPRQIAFVLNIQQPLVVADRAALTTVLMKDPRYARANDLMHKVEQRMLDTSPNWWEDDPEGLIGKNADYNEAFLQKAAPIARSFATQYLKSLGYDGVHVLHDEGAMGRKTETYVVFSKTQARRVKFRWT